MLHCTSIFMCSKSASQIFKLLFQNGDINIFVLRGVFFRVRSHDRRNELILVWDFKPAWKQVLFTWMFHFGCVSKRPDILMDMCRHFISGSVYIIFYQPKWNFISVKMTDMKFILALSFKLTRALNATSNESTLFILFWVNYVHMKISWRFGISLRSKWRIWNSYRFEFHFVSIHVNTSKELTEHRSEIFDRNEISYWLEFISPLM